MKSTILSTILVASLALSGCATLYDQLGLVTKASLTDESSRLADLETRITALASQIDTMSTTAQDLLSQAELRQKQIEEVQGLLAELKDKVNLLPAQTLRTLASVLAAAADSAEAPPAAAETKTP